jgi:hypothetical protein
MKPSPPYFGFVLASCGKLQGLVNRGFRKSPHMSYSESDCSDEELCKFVDKVNINSDTSVKVAAATCLDVKGKSD